MGKDKDDDRMPIPLPPRPATNAELIAAIDGYRHQLDEFVSRTSSNLQWLTDGLKARLDAADREAYRHMHPDKDG